MCFQDAYSENFTTEDKGNRFISTTAYVLQVTTLISPHFDDPALLHSHVHICRQKLKRNTENDTSKMRGQIHPSFVNRIVYLKLSAPSATLYIYVCVCVCVCVCARAYVSIYVRIYLI